MDTKLQSIDPSSGELLGDVHITPLESVAQVVSDARTARNDWGKIAIDERIYIIQKAYAAVENKMMELAELLSREMGKDIRRAAGEVQGVIYGGPYIAQSAGKALKTIHVGGSEVEYRPFGTVAVISPWNYPLAMANNLIVPALVAGNTVVWKPSEETPLIAQAFYEILNSKLPENVLQIIHGNGEQGRLLVESDVDMIAFTGSQAAGKDIMRRASGGVKRLIMELGGNDPLIVLGDADIHAAARFAVGSSFENAGQMCTSTERIYVDETVADEFEKLVVQYAKQYKTGPWNMDGVNIGPIINTKQHRTIVEHIADAILKGATCLLGGSKQEPPYIKPTILTGMSPIMLIEREETFGPVVCISRYSDLKEAIGRANDSSYGLGAVVYGSTEASAVADQLVAGMIGINQGAGGGGDLPWVGAKQSGLGFHGSADGHKQFAQVRIVSH